MLAGRASSVSLLLFVVACGTSPPSPAAPVATARASDCAALARQLASFHATLETPAEAGEPPRRAFEAAQRDFRATPTSAGAARGIAIGYADLLRDFLGVMDRADTQVRDLHQRSEALRGPSRPAIAAFKKHCPRADDDEESDCARIRAVFETSLRQDPDCERCTEQLADRLQALVVADAELVRLKPDLVKALRDQATIEGLARTSRTAAKGDYDALVAREIELQRRAHAVCPAVEITRIFPPQ